MSLVDLVMPKLGESIMEATILKWYKQVGDTINLDETLLDIATDKVDSEVPSTVKGVIKEILFSVNDIVPIGAVIARIESGDSTHLPTVPNVVNSVREEIPYVPTPTSHVTNSKIETSISTGSGEIKFYSPLVLNIAQSEGVSLNELQLINGTGSQGRVSKKDILNYIAAKKVGILPTKTEVANFQKNDYNRSLSTKHADPVHVVLSGNTEIVEMDRMRKLIAKHMVDSVQTSPHVTSFVEVDVTNMVLWREKVKQQFEAKEGTKLTYTPMFLEGIAAALEQFPIVNSSLQNDQIVYKKDINIGMATALPTGNLIVPVIKGANQLNIVGLSKAVNGLANAARNNQLKPSDTQGGTFTVTNVGTFGSIMGTPIINQPQVAILALGAIKKRAVVIETTQGDTIGIRHMMYLSMSYDHRIVDGAVGSQFLAAVAKTFEHWDPNK